MIPTIQTYIDSSRNGLLTLQTFCDNHTLDLPDEMLSCYAHSATARFDIAMSYCPNEHGHAKVLSIIGDVFGREGWMNVAQTSYGDHHFDWEKVVDGVKITVKKAELMPKFDNAPVPPQKFPVLLMDSLDEQNADLQKAEEYTNDESPF